MFGLLRNHRLTYQDRYDTGGGVTAFAFTTDSDLRARPGQHGILAASATSRKPFSLASAPEEERVLIGTSLASGSPFKRRLADLRKGDQLAMRGPIYTYGQHFMVDHDARSAVLLAQGVGITPFRSILAHLALAGTDIATSLIHVSKGGHAFREDTERWATKSYYPDHADDFRAAASTAADNGQASFYVAGAPGFVSSTTALLRERGVNPRRIHQDTYLFYKPHTNLAEPDTTSSS